MPAVERLRERLAEVADLGKAAALLSWDERVMMPPGGAQARAEALATVSRLAQERFVTSEMEQLLDELRDLEESTDYDSFEASLIRVTRHDFEKASRVPPELVGELRREAALAVAAWGPAKESSDFESLRPYLEKNLELRLRYVDCFDPADETYDVLLDDYEPNMKTAEVREIFDELKQHLVPLIREIGEAGAVDDSFLTGDFDPQRQREFSLEIARQFGYTDAEWRLDQTAHPFMSSPGAGDIRLTSARSSPRCTSSVTASTSGASIRLWRVRRWGAASRTASTNRRAEPGKTLLGAAARSGASSIRGSRPRSRRSSSPLTKRLSTVPSTEFIRR
jgi:carboxypeptidase Taq